MVGGAVKIKNSDGEINDTHRVYLLSETGSLFEFTEGETDLSECCPTNKKRLAQDQPLSVQR